MGTQRRKGLSHFIEKVCKPFRKMGTVKPSFLKPRTVKPFQKRLETANRQPLRPPLKGVVRKNFASFARCRHSDSFCPSSISLLAPSLMKTVMEPLENLEGALSTYVLKI